MINRWSGRKSILSPGKQSFFSESGTVWAGWYEECVKETSYMVRRGHGERDKLEYPWREAYVSCRRYVGILQEHGSYRESRWHRG